MKPKAKTYIERQHIERITAPGWDGRVISHDRNHITFTMRGRPCALIRAGRGFFARADHRPLNDQPEYPDAAVAIIWRYLHS